MNMDNPNRSLGPVRIASPVVTASAPPPTESVMQVQDIYYLLFRHKWKLIACSLLGFAAAAAYYFIQPPSYEAEAKLFIRYVVTEGRTLSPNGGDEVRKSPDMRGETIMDSEIEVLKSLDLARQVVDVVGVEKLLPKTNSTKDPAQAAAAILKGLIIEVPPRSTVIRLIFRHRNPEVVQPVLRALIDAYFARHIEIHRAAGITGDFLGQETDQLRSRLAQTEEELQKLKNKAGVVSLDETKKSYSAQMAHLREQIFAAQAEYAARAAALQERIKLTGATAPARKENDPATAPVAPSNDQLDEYKSTVATLNLLQAKERQLLTQFTDENARVKEVRGQIAEANKLKTSLEERFPALVQTPKTAAAATDGTPVSPAPPILDGVSEAASLAALEAKIKTLNTQLDSIKAEVANIDTLELKISELGRQKELYESNYRFYAASLEQSRISEALGAGKVSNITQIQAPSPPALYAGNTKKTAGGLAAGGLALGLGWALLLEFYLDRSVRRPVDVEKTLGLRLFISIPERNPLRQSKSAKNGTSANGETSIAIREPNDERAELKPFHEALRDRLIGYFDRKNLTHKPKLVAVSGIGTGGGVTTTAAGLARALSDTGEGNVLLVDMTASQGSAQHFYHGKAVCALDSVLAMRESAQVQDNLYVVSDSDARERVSGILPQRFSKLVPKLKSSDFDYIIFDMPPVTQISVTPRIAGFMDIVLLVIESEMTDREVVRQAANMLVESRADVGAVLNRTRTYIPSWLHHDHLANC